VSRDEPSGLQAAFIHFAIRYRGFVVALSCLFLGYGIYALSSAKYDLFPEFAPPQVSIQTEAVGMTPEQVEILVTRPIENAINGVPGVQTLRSTSIQGLSVVTVYFDATSDIYRDRQVVAERLAAAAGALPQGVKPPSMTPLTSSTSVMLVAGLNSDTRSLMDLAFLREEGVAVINELEDLELDTYNPGNAFEALGPKSRYGFRIVHQLPIVDTVLLLAAVIDVGPLIEAHRPAANGLEAFSYRFVLDGNGGLFQMDRTFKDWLKKQLVFVQGNLKIKHVITTDISDFYARINFHRLENLLDEAAPKHGASRYIKKHIKVIRAKQSFGLPVGGSAARLLAELALSDIDRALGFVPRKNKSGTSHEHWVATINGQFRKVTVDCPKAPFSADLIGSMAKQAGVSKKQIYEIYSASKLRHLQGPHSTPGPV
jgi:hypothetical protein